jgi:hypothetical protein
MELRSYEAVMGRSALEGTKWENLLHFWDTTSITNPE